MKTNHPYSYMLLSLSLKFIPSSLTIRTHSADFAHSFPLSWTQRTMKMSFQLSCNDTIKTVGMWCIHQLYTKINHHIRNSRVLHLCPAYIMEWIHYTVQFKNLFILYSYIWKSNNKIQSWMTNVEWLILTYKKPWKERKNPNNNRKNNHTNQKHMLTQQIRSCPSLVSSFPEHH